MNLCVYNQTVKKRKNQHTQKSFIFIHVNFMKNNAQTGQNAELLAQAYLIKKNYRILFTNWRHKHAEIDIIAQDGKVVVFIEVKARKNNSFGHPEEFVDKHKMKKMHEAADAYIRQFDWPGELRFDIISIENETKITHFEDAFY